MSSIEQKTIEHLDQMNKVVSKYLEGNDETKISKSLNLPRQRVVAFLTEWRQMAANNAAIRDRAREALVAADTHYSKLIGQAYEAVSYTHLTLPTKRIV